MEKSYEEEMTRGHCLILPFPLQGHINPMLQFSKRLADKGIAITLAATNNSLKTSPDFPGSISVAPIFDEYDDGKHGGNLEAYLDWLQQTGSEAVSEMLENLKNSGRPVDCVIYDPFLPWAVLVAKRFGLVGAAFFTQSSFVNIIYYNVYKGQLKVPLPDDKELISVAGLPPLEISDMPSFVRELELHPGKLQLVTNQFLNIEEADYVFVNSIYELEQEATDWMAKLLPVKTIGPTVPSMYLDKRLKEDKDYGLSIFKPVGSCMKWLDQRPPKSVIYVSFGSMAKLESEQMEELALGLKMSGDYFLWVVRSSEESKLPDNFAEETCEKGLIVSWCPQLEVLAHEATGCFVTHCGWNSTLEALSLGVPMVGVPWWSDQSTNAKLVMDVWKTGVRACPDDRNVVRGAEIVGCVRRVMMGLGGEEMKKNARKWSDLVREAVDEGGSSDTNIQQFVSSLLLGINLPPN